MAVGLETVPTSVLPDHRAPVMAPAATMEEPAAAALDLPLYSPIKDPKPNIEIKTAEEKIMQDIILNRLTKLTDFSSKLSVLFKR